MAETPWFKAGFSLFYTSQGGLFLLRKGYSCSGGVIPWGYTLGFWQFWQKGEKQSFLQF